LSDLETFYGFSGGSYNLRYILRSLAKNHPDTLHRIDFGGRAWRAAAA